MCTDAAYQGTRLKIRTRVSIYIRARKTGTKEWQSRRTWCQGYCSFCMLPFHFLFMSMCVCYIFVFLQSRFSWLFNNMFEFEFEFVLYFCQETFKKQPLKNISGPSVVQSLVGCSVSRPIMHPSHRSTNLYFAACLQPIEQESVMLTGQLGDALPFLGLLQNRQKNTKKYKIQKAKNIPLPNF